MFYFFIIVIQLRKNFLRLHKSDDHISDSKDYFDKDNNYKNDVNNNDINNNNKSCQRQQQQ